ncbi:MAG: hypothetical protein AB7G21_09770 [Dehalococcoidia bacterium]
MAGNNKRNLLKRAAALAEETGFARYAHLRVAVYEPPEGGSPQVIAAIPFPGLAGQYQGRWSADVGAWNEVPEAATPRPTSPSPWRAFTGAPPAEPAKEPEPVAAQA